MGGVLASIPTTIIPASIGFALQSQNELEFVAPLLAVPFGMLVNAIFLYTWRIFPSRLPSQNFYFRLKMMIVISLLIWFVCAVLSIFIQEHYASLALSTCIVVLQFLFGVIACLRNPPAPKGKNAVGWGTLAFRGVLAGVAIGVSVLLSYAGALAGIASVFPAIFLTTMISIWLAQGEAVQGGAVGPMMLGSSSVSVYALLCILIFPKLGFLVGALVAWFLSILIISLPSAVFLRKIRPYSSEDS